jgi:hypothetical protein
MRGKAGATGGHEGSNINSPHFSMVWSGFRCNGGGGGPSSQSRFRAVMRDSGRVWIRSRRVGGRSQAPPSWIDDMAFFEHQHSTPTNNCNGITRPDVIAAPMRLMHTESDAAQS